MLAELTLERWTPAAPPDPLEPRPARGRGLRIVQVFMQGFIDAGLNRAGAGDGGGLATLLVHLSAALAARPEVEQVTTLTRAFAADGTARRERWRHGAAIERCRSAVTATSPPATCGRIAASSSAAWRRRSAGSRRSTRSTCASPTSRRSPPSASARGSACPCTSRSRPTRTRSSAAARRAASSTATASSSADQREHLLFRARLVERLRDRAPRPRAAAARQRRARAGGARRPARGCAAAPGPHRAGGHLDRRRVDAAAARGRRDTAAAADLAAGCRRLPRARHGLPLILSVGRLHRVKGFATLLEAWAGDPELRERVQPRHRRGRPRAPDAPRSELVLEALELPRPHPARSTGCCCSGTGRTATCSRLMAAARAGSRRGHRAGRRLRLREREGGVRPRAAGGDGVRAVGARARARAVRRPSSTTASPACSPTPARSRAARRAAPGAAVARDGPARVPRWRRRRCASTSRSRRWRAG